MHGIQATSSDRGGIEHPAGSLGGRPQIGAGHPARAERVQTYWLHNRPEAAADHDRERAGGPRRNAAAADLPRPVLTGTYAAATGPRPRTEGLRRIGQGARAAGAVHQAVVRGGIGGHGKTVGSIRRRDKMTAVTQALSTALLHFVWQGAAVALILWMTLFLLRKR